MEGDSHRNTECNSTFNTIISDLMEIVNNPDKKKEMENNLLKMDIKDIHNIKRKLLNISKKIKEINSKSTINQE